MVANPYASPIEAHLVDDQSQEGAIRYKTFRGKRFPLISSETYRNEVRERAIAAIKSEIDAASVITIKEHSANWPFSVTVWYRT